MSSVPVSVAVHGWTWSAALLAVLNLLIGGVLVTLIKTRPAIKKMANEREVIANSREANLLTERAAEMELMRETIKSLSARLDAKEIQHEAERAYDRHRINNLATSLNGFLMMVKAHPDDAAKAAQMIEDLRARQIEEENRENIALRALIASLTAPKAD